jgi:hypothetical protein
MMKDLENVAHDPTHRAPRLVNVSDETDLALIEPDAVAPRTRIDLYVLEISLLQVFSAPRAFHEMLATLGLSPLFVEQGAHFLDQARILACKVLVFVTSWMFL